MMIYLINKQDRYCPENNNGDYFVEAYLGKVKAEKRVKVLDKQDPMWAHYVCEMEILDYPK
jgi:hypothetical protein